jgi:DNA-binding transcriptional LysR family regulator
MHAIVLRYFQEVARLGSIRKASEALFVASSAVSRQILKLEEELGTELFNRLPSGMTLNPAGERLLKHVQNTLHDFQMMRGELHALRGEFTGHVKVAAMDSLFEDFMPAAVEEFSTIFPAVTYTVTAVAPMDAAQMVFSGQIDTAITFVTRLQAGVQTAATFNLPIGVVMAPGHPLATRDEIDLAECRGLPFLRSLGQPPISTTMCPEFGAFWDQLEPNITCNWTPMVKRLIMAGRGISFFSKIAFIRELERGELVWRPFALPSLRDIKVAILVPAQRELPAITQNFVGRMARRLKQVEVAAAGFDDSPPELNSPKEP